MKRFIVALVFAVLSMNAMADCYSSGVRVGFIQKFSLKGFINKSWEGEMVQGGIRDKNASVTNIWKFSVTDANVAKKIEDAMFEGGDVAVKYCQSYIKIGLIANTDYIVTDAKAQK